MFFTYDHSDLGELEVMVVTGSRRTTDKPEFMVCDHGGNEIDYKPFYHDLIKIAEALRDDAEAQDKFEELRYE